MMVVGAGEGSAAEDVEDGTRAPASRVALVVEKVAAEAVGAVANRESLPRKPEGGVDSALY